MAREPAVLDLAVLGELPGMPALTPSKGRTLAEAAAVCLENRRHSQNVPLKVTGTIRKRFRLRWPSVTPQMERTYSDLQDATRDGAYGVAIPLARELTGLSALLQSRKGTGFDYWIGESLDDLFQNASRLEVSGILHGDESQIKSRVRRKELQTQRSDKTRLPAFVCVVEFSRPEARLVER